MSDWIPCENAAAESRRRKIVATYDYTDEAGAVQWQKVRFDPKGFAIRTSSPIGWEWSRAARTRPLLYRLHQIVQRPTHPVIVVEGEKDADRLAALGLLATTGDDGANGWAWQHAEYLKGRRVVVIPDNDGPGRVYARDVVGSCLMVGVESVRVVALPDGAKDVSDFLASGKGKADVVALVKASHEWKACQTEIVKAAA